MWDLSVRDQAWAAEIESLYRTFTFDELAPQLGPANIDRTVVVQTVTEPDETHELLALASQRAQIAGVVGWIDIGTDTVSAQLDDLTGSDDAHWLVGLRHQVQLEPDPDYLTRPDVHAALRAIGRAGLTYDLVVTEQHWRAVTTAARAVPDLRFVLDHAGKPPIATGALDPWREWIADLARLPHVACKLSGLLTEAGTAWSLETIRPFSDHILDSFGASRIMFGSDWPVSTAQATYAEVVETARSLVRGASQDEHDQIFGSTAVAWYRLASDTLPAGE